MVSAQVIDPETSNWATRASAQWWSRPNDQRFLTLEDLLAQVSKRRGNSHEESHSYQDLEIVHEFAPNPPNWNDPDKDFDEKGVIFMDTDDGRADFTNWSFGQLSTGIGAPASYLRKLRADIAALNISYGLGERGEDRTKGLIVKTENGVEIRSFTSETYGRIWDADVVEKVIHLNEMTGGIWQVPDATYKSKDPLRATTLYGSDRDCFMFLVDKSNPVEVDGEQLFRGFMAWNSEVGSQVFGLTTFYYRYVCDNRIIWGGKGVNELRIRHTQFGPSRFDYEAVPFLERYVNMSASSMKKTVHRARHEQLGKTIEEVQERLTKKMGLGKKLVQDAINRAQIEEPGMDPKTIWAVVQGITAVARDIPHTDDRIAVEKQANGLMDMAEKLGQDD